MLYKNKNILNFCVRNDFCDSVLIVIGILLKIFLKSLVFFKFIDEIV